MQGWYWPAIGPQNTLYVPGPVLQGCNNELVLLEVGDTLTANGTKTSAAPTRASLGEGHATRIMAFA